MEINKVINGNCYELLNEIPSKSVDLVYIDIPYQFQSGCGKRKCEKLKETIQKNYELMIKATNKMERKKYRINKEIAEKKLELWSHDITSGIDYSIFDELVRVMKHIYIIIWCSKDQIYDIMDYFIKGHNCNFNLLVWCKANPTPMCNGSWLPDIEYCLVFKGEGAPKYNNGYHLKSKYHISEKNVDDKKEYKHPTIKPLDLVKRHILHCTNEGDLVLDCFAGSGTTCVACKETKRNFIGIEIDEEFCKIANDRLNGISADGQTSIFTDFER